jgi:hypothetical protein
MTRKKTSETERRLRSVLCDEPVPGFDLDAHAHNIAAAVGSARRAAVAAEAAADLTPEADLAADLTSVVRARA